MNTARSLFGNWILRQQPLPSLSPPNQLKVVGIVMNHSIETIASLFAILKVGAAYVPIELTFPIEHIRFIMQECNVDLVLTEHEYAEN